MGSVFISYRRGDSEGQARLLSLQLEELLGKDSVFMDVDSIALGRDFRDVLAERLQSCDLMLALIGPDWIDAADSRGTRRLDSPTDFVRQEIATALKRKIRVTPNTVHLSDFGISWCRHSRRATGGPRWPAPLPRCPPGRV